MKVLFIVVNVDWFFLSHRKEIAMEASKQGYKVTIIANDTGFGRTIQNLGLNFINYPMDRASLNLWSGLKSFYFLYKVYQRAHPDVVHHVGLKVIFLGGLAATLTKVKGVVNAISGLGVSFAEEQTEKFKTRLYIFVLAILHRSWNLNVIFQNNEDKSIFLENSIISKPQAILIKGSGIDLHEYHFSAERETLKLKILLTARMLLDKGILEFIEAASILKSEYSKIIEFILCGGLDENPKAISRERLEGLVDGDYIKWLGYRTDVKHLLQESHIVVLPSYYREGLPKSLIEAAAIGRPIITTNSVGCKDVVEDGVNGFLIPIKDSVALANKLKILIDNRKLRIEFGEKSRILAEREFSIKNVIDKHLKIYSKLDY